MHANDVAQALHPRRRNLVARSSVPGGVATRHPAVEESTPRKKSRALAIRVFYGVPRETMRSRRQAVMIYCRGVSPLEKGEPERYSATIYEIRAGRISPPRWQLVARKAMFCFAQMWRIGVE